MRCCRRPSRRVPIARPRCAPRVSGALAEVREDDVGAALRIVAGRVVGEDQGLLLDLPGGAAREVEMHEHISGAAAAAISPGWVVLVDGEPEAVGLADIERLPALAAAAGEDVV